MATDKSGNRATASELDKLTGIRIGGSVFREDRVYRNSPVIRELFGGAGLGGSVDITGLQAEVDVNRSRLVLFATAKVSAGGFNPDLSLKLVFAGKASGKTGIARDFTASDLAAGLYAGSGLDTELIASVEPRGKGLKLNKAFRTLAKNSANFPELVDVSSVAVAATGPLASQVGSLLAGADLTLSPRTQVVGPFRTDFSGDWWSAGL